MSVNEIFIASVAGRFMSFTITYSLNVQSSTVDYTLSCYSLDSYGGHVDFVFSELSEATSTFNAFAAKSCVRYELFLGYRVSK